MLANLSKDPTYVGKVFHVDARNTLGDDPETYMDDWANELHPTSSGFRSIAKKFNDVIQARM